ncbi:restriction endonuclease subunit S [Mangrovimonas cancribranchiae]|uniref:Restriction endonuclease subunit S n=1 Tax=Mangrovimonas cancribranchiae TaxID=3080055 RepID=A0AAU6PBN4_9FLAO
MESKRISQLETYLLNNGLNEYQLTDKEKKALENFDKCNWNIFNLENLFGKSTRGRRLKSADRVSGALPFITAGETDQGISAFIGNDVKVFSANTTTIDMFGSAKYRNFKYGGDDHIAVVHTNKLPKYASVFVTSAIHKSSYNGQFNYGRNFYAKDADALDISLPVKDGKPDYEIMETIISAIHKLVIKDVVLYVEKKKKELNKLTENANAVKC